MPELDDHKTDSLFQVGAGRHDFEYEPAAWEQMEVLLNADDSARRRRIFWFLGIAVVILLSLIFFGYQDWGADELKTEPTLTELDSQQESTSATTTPIRIEDGIMDESVDEIGTDATINASITEEEVVSITTPDPSLNAKNNLAAVPASSPQKRTEERTSVIKSKSSDIDSQPVESSESIKTDDESPAEPTSDPDEVLKREASAFPLRTDQLVIILPQQPIPFLDYERKLPEKEIQLIKSTTAASATPLISVGLSAGLVLGSVETAGFGTTRPRFGAKVDYRLGKKFSIGTGAYLNKVYYKADGEDYKAGEEIWTDGIEPESILADCNVLEIPLSLTFFPKGSNKSGLYAATGLTSYFMMKEVFAFNYDSPRDDLIKGWKEENTNKHLLGLGHFNLGYQRKNGQRSAFQIESFVHLPLQGIGHGKVNLITAGASINYTFGLKRKK
jgi:hypothetical protein